MVTMNNIKVNFEVEKKHFGEIEFVQEAFDVAWVKVDTRRVDILYLQVYDKFNHYIFHTFLTQERAVHNIPLRIHEDPSQYLIYAYGLTLCRESESPYYVIQMGASAGLDSLLRFPGDDIENLLLVPGFKYEPLLDSEQSSYGIDVAAHGPTKYAFAGFQPGEFYIIFLHHLYSGDTSVLLKLGGNAEVSVIPYDLRPACEFSFQCFRVKRGKETSFLGKSHSTVCRFRSYMTTFQVLQLLNKAIQFVGVPNNLLLLTHFYRNKSYKYFSNIMTNCAGVMAKYVKNWGGDQFSILNGRLHGLFFSAAVDPKTLLPPSFSYYGVTRLYIPTSLLLNSGTNLYFADFYCHYINHKVQLVITRKGSDSDCFCSRFLVRLDPFNNQFWRSSFWGSIYVTTKVTVEVFYTEDIPITAWQQHYQGIYFQQTQLKGNALAMVVGIPKREDCTICNFDHVIQAKTHK